MFWLMFESAKYTFWPELDLVAGRHLDDGSGLYIADKCSSRRVTTSTRRLHMPFGRFFLGPDLEWTPRR